MDGRHARGRVLAQAHGDRIKQIEGDLWFVPSSQGAGGYLVSDGRCSCPDEDERCKHVVAVEIVRAAMVKPDAAPAVAAPTVPAKAKAPPRGDLTVEEQAAVRRALKFIRTRAGGWDAVAKGTRFTVRTLKHLSSGRPLGGSLAVRLARFAGVSVDDLIAGRFPPPGACPHCGQIAPVPGSAGSRKASEPPAL